MRIFSLGTVLAFLFLSQAAHPCDLVQTPLREQLNEMGKDLTAIFRKQGIAFETKQPVLRVGTGTPIPEPSPTPAEDWLIVPGERAGRFEIGMGAQALSQQVRLSAPRRRSDPRYEDLLPLAYVPEREFRKAQTSALEFAVSLHDRRLSEIFVRDPKYATAQGIRPGSPESELGRQGKLSRRRGKDGQDYFQGEGITFVTRDGKVVEIAVTKRSTAR